MVWDEWKEKRVLVTVGELATYIKAKVEEVLISSFVTLLLRKLSRRM